MMGGRGVAVCLWGVLCAASVPRPGQAEAVDTMCTSVHVRLDPRTWNAARADFLGKALGQTFLARDTLISRLTVWRPPNYPSPIGAHLYITEVDTTRTPPRPNTGAILLDGPTLRVYDSDPPGQLIEMSFVIDPPLRLPRPGLYAFFLQAEDCNQGQSWWILANDQNPYPYGIFWMTGRVSYPCHLRAVDSGEDNVDLLFDIEYCRPDANTPVRRGSWGQLKVRYH